MLEPLLGFTALYQGGLVLASLAQGRIVVALKRKIIFIELVTSDRKLERARNERSTDLKDSTIHDVQSIGEINYWTEALTLLERAWGSSAVSFWARPGSRSLQS